MLSWQLRTMSIRVSYILSTFNRAKYLERALTNVREVIASDDELLVMDGGSTDGTADVVSKNRDIVTAHFCEPDEGEAHAANKGMLRARGRWLKFLTDDDEIFPDAARQAVRVLEEHPEIDALQCGGEHWVQDGDTQRLAYVAWHPPDVPWKSDPRHVYTSRVGCGNGLYLTSRAIARVGLLDTTYRAMDTEYIVRLIAHSRIDFRFLAVRLYRHVLYPHSVATDPSRTHRDRVRIFLQMLTMERPGTQSYPLAEIAHSLGLTNADLERALLGATRRTGRQGGASSAIELARAFVTAGRIGWSTWSRVRNFVADAPGPSPLVPVWNGVLS
jgi:glycosyltransferase involved in cell wall biosynthesis